MHTNFYRVKLLQIANFHNFSCFYFHAFPFNPNIFNSFKFMDRYTLSVCGQKSLDKRAKMLQCFSMTPVLLMAISVITQALNLNFCVHAYFFYATQFFANYSF